MGRVLRGDVTITTIDLSSVKIMSVKLYSEDRILWASLCASFVRFNQKLREWQHLSAYFLNTPRILLEGLNQFHGTNLTLNSDVDQDT